MHTGLLPLIIVYLCPNLPAMAWPKEYQNIRPEHVLHLLDEFHIWCKVNG